MSGDSDFVPFVSRAGKKANKLIRKKKAEDELEGNRIVAQLKACTVDAKMMKQMKKKSKKNAEKKKTRMQLIAVEGDDADNRNHVYVGLSIVFSFYKYSPISFTSNLHPHLPPTRPSIDLSHVPT